MSMVNVGWHHPVTAGVRRNTAPEGSIELHMDGDNGADLCIFLTDVEFKALARALHAAETTKAIDSPDRTDYPLGERKARPRYVSNML